MGLLEPLLVTPYGLLLGTALALVWALCVACRRRRRPGEPPLVNSWIPFLGDALNFFRDPYDFLQTLKQKHGDIFTVHIGGTYITFIMDPLQHVSFTKNSKYLDFLQLSDRLASKIFDYPSILLPEFKNMNEIVHRAYQHLQGKSLDVLIDSTMKNMQHLFKRKFSQATDWETANLRKFCSSLIFEITITTLYGKDPHCHNTDEMLDKFTKFDARFPYLAGRMPIELLGATKSLRKELIHCFLPKYMSRRLEVSEVIQDRIDMLEMYKILGDYDKAAHHFAFMWATVANTLPVAFWSMYYLLRHPEAVAVVRNEIDHLLQSTGQERRSGYSIHLTREQLDNLPYLESALNETLRMCTSSVIMRLAKEDFILKLEGNKEIRIRKGDTVTVYPPLLHMDPEVYKDPKKYKFDRYVENGKKKTDFYKEGKKLKQFLMPFGCGISICPGRFFAQNEIKLMIIFLLANFDIEIIEDKEVEPKKRGVLFGSIPPSSDILFRYKLRS